MESPTFFEALAEASGLFASAHASALIDGAHEVGLISRLAVPQPSEDLAAGTGLAEERVTAVCRALAAFDVVRGEADGTWRLSPAWATFVRPGAVIALPEILGLARIEGKLYRELGRGGTYWDLSTEDRLAYARGVSPNPFSEDLVAAFRAAAELDPDAGAMQAGADYLELGCGVAGRMLTTLQAFPMLRGVGVELSADLVAEARRRAQQLRLADRFEVVEADAGEFYRPAGFDFGFWSQFFFPSGARAAALAALFRALRPGGVAWAPLVTDFEANAADPDRAEARSYVLRRVLLESWGVPERTFPDLKSEFESAGFVDVTRTGGGSQGPVRLRAVRP